MHAVLDRGLAVLLLIASLPVIGALALFVIVVDGRPCFHRGVRLGRGKRPFAMYKLRTLAVGAEQVTGGQLLDHRHDLTIRGGRFLRDTRLDELPQLWNIVRGDMLFVGPRPERPEVFDAQCAEIPGYARRFAVRPGLIGISQLFTPHGTPKRYRALIDNGGLRRCGGVFQRFAILGYTLWAMLREICVRAKRQLFVLRAHATGIYREKRKLRRVAPAGAVAYIGTARARVIDMNEETVLVECEAEPATTELLLDIPVRGFSAPARRTARVRGDVLDRRNGTQFLVRYVPCSPRSAYMIHQYFLCSSLALPRRRLASPPRLPALRAPAILASAPQTAAAPSRPPAPALPANSRPEPARVVRPALAMGSLATSPSGVMETLRAAVDPSSSVGASVTAFEPGMGRMRDTLARAEVLAAPLAGASKPQGPQSL